MKKTIITVFILLLPVICFAGDRNDVQQQINKSISDGKMGLYDQAISKFNEDIKIDPNNADAYNNRGLAHQYYKRGLDQALSDYSKAIEINPAYAGAYNNRGLLYGKYKGEFDKAISDFTKAIEINPNFPEALL